MCWRAGSFFALTVLPANQPPTIFWIDPTNDLTLTLSQPVTLAVDANDPDGVVTRVEFWAGTNLVGVATNAPYSIVWSNTIAGARLLTAVATDDRGAFTTSPTLSLIFILPDISVVPAKIESANALVDGQFELHLSGPAGYDAIVEATSDWQQWTPVATNRFENGAATCVDAASAQFSMRFYRVRLQSTP